MNKKRESYYKTLFFIGALYDLILGIIFAFFYKPAFSFLKISLPEFPGYLSLIGVFLIVLGIGYYYISKSNIKSNKDLIKVGTLYKFAYAAVAFFYLIQGTIPNIIFAWLFGVLDLIFGVLFIECLNYIKN